MRKFFVVLICTLFFVSLNLLSACTRIRTLKTEIVNKENESFIGENTSLYLGNPSSAKRSRNERTNYLIEKKQYALSYNSQSNIANWVSWHLCSSDLGATSRSPNFTEEFNIPFGWYKVKHSDFQFSTYGFERGHLCPSADRTSSQEDNNATFTMSNVIPQSPKNNSTVWNDLEQYCRRLAERGNELYIVAGTHGTGGESRKGKFENIPTSSKNTKINVPAFIWKVIIIIPEGKNDIERITKETRTIAVITPNTQDCSPRWRDYSVSIDYLEELTGYNFFDIIPDEIEDILEARVTK